MSIADALKMKDLEDRISVLEKWVKDFEEWPKPDPEIVKAATEIQSVNLTQKRGPGRPRKTDG